MRKSKNDTTMSGGERLFTMAVSVLGLLLSLVYRDIPIREPIIMSWAGIIWFCITFYLGLIGVKYARLLGQKGMYQTPNRVSVINAIVFAFFVFGYVKFS